jgi:hypothetical protein
MNFAGFGAGPHQRRKRRHPLTPWRQILFKRRARLLLRRTGLVGIIRPRYPNACSHSHRVDAGFAGVWYLVVVAKWYVFWAVGVRLSLAGLRQIVQPGYTAETILGLKGAASLFVVREMGFAKAMGSIGIASLFAALILATCCFAQPRWSRSRFQGQKRFSPRLS